jgi:8-oxo-dGTP pyrophosphatase MutT (NUDIX family)
MAQTYKIFINGKPLYLSKKGVVENLPEKTLRATYTGSKKWILPHLQELENSQKYDCVLLEYHDLDRLWADFMAIFEVIEAAGGLVFNEKNELLVMFRRGSWDLPKGKIDDGESVAEAAVREVREECGLENIRLDEPILTSFHTYFQKNRRVLKPTHWFRMFSNDQNLVPQTSEGIEKLVWVEPKNWIAAENNVYPNIRDVILAAI